MLDNKYAVKYKIPHTLLHIVDNSGNRDAVPTTVAEDPSLFSSIVVTATPMGVDNKIVTLTRADVASISFGLNNVTAEDIRKYGQSIEYPLALIENGQAPVRLLRVTPDGSTYACAVILVQWKIENEEMHVRFVKGEIPAGIRADRFKNPEKLNEAIVAKTEAASGDGWNQRVFMNVIAAGRGKIYNDFAFAINFGQQGKRPTNCRYIFSTINTNTSNIVERFAASISNETAAGITYYDPLDDVNTVVGKRMEGSSILVPFLNKEAVTAVYKEYTDLMNLKMDEPNGLTDDELRYYKTLNINIFDMVFGHYIYEGSEYDIRLPHYLVDMIDTEIALLPERDRFGIIEDSTNKFEQAKPNILWNYLYPNTYGVTHEGDAVYVGSTYLSYVSNCTNPVINIVTGVNQYTGAVTSVGYDHVFVKDVLGTDTDRYYSKKLSALIPDLNIKSEDDITENSLKDLLNKSSVLARLIRVGVLKPVDDTSLDLAEPTENGFYAIAYALTNGTYDICSVKIVKNGNDIKVGQVYLNKDSSSNALKILDVIDFSGAGTGNLIGVVKVLAHGGASNIDAAFTRAGYTCIDGSVCANPANIQTEDTRVDKKYVTNPTSTTLYVNGYDVAFDDITGTLTGTQINVVNNTNVCGNAPTAVNIVNSIIGHEYDVIVYPAEYMTKVTRATPVIKTLTLTSQGAGSKISDNEPEAGVTTDIGSIITDETGLIKYKVTGVAVAPGATGGHPTKIELVSWDKTYTNDFGTVTDLVLKTTSGTPAPVCKITVDYRDMKVTRLSEDLSAKSIIRYSITGSIGSLNRAQVINNAVPVNYYTSNFGLNPSTEAGGFRLSGGSTGFFDEDVSSIEFKWRYSELLVKAYRGEIDPRIMSPARCPAKYMFDGGTNTIVGQNIVGNVSYRPVDIINASTIFTEEEKDAIMYDEAIVDSFVDDYATTNDIDVKQAMYDLMVYRCYYGMPEEKRPIGPGYGLSLHLDAGITDATTTSLTNSSFKKRFTNPNASWDIGGFTSTINGVTYTYTKWIVDHLIEHCKATSVNKPFVMTYATIPNTEYTSFFPDLDITDWDMREMLYNSGGNAWVPDINGNLVRRSQRTMKQDNELSDLIQESNMRTLSQLCYILQNTIDEKLFEYNDDGFLKTLTDICNNKFSNWVGNLVEALDISFERDINPLDGGEIVVCYCNVTFRGLILRVPIIVNVQHRNI